MASERTLSIIKPDATERNLTGQIIARLEGAGILDGLDQADGALRKLARRGGGVPADHSR